MPVIGQMVTAFTISDGRHELLSAVPIINIVSISTHSHMSRPEMTRSNGDSDGMLEEPTGKRETTSG